MRQIKYIVIAFLFTLVSCLAMTMETFEYDEVVPQVSEPEVVEAEDKWFYPLSADDFTLVCGVVAAEARGESYEGQMAVAQTILTRMRSRDATVEDVIKGQYAKPLESKITESISSAVEAVFRYGETVIDPDVEYFYAPALCTSKWHESLVYVGTIGCHRFFKRS